MKELAEGRASIAAHLEKARRLTARWHELETQAGGAPALEVAYARHYGAPPGVGMAHVSSGGGPMVPMRFYHGVGYEAPAFRPEVLEAMRQHDEEHERRMAELTARLDQARTKTRRVKQQVAQDVQDVAATAAKAKDAIDKASAPVQRTLF